MYPISYTVWDWRQTGVAGGPGPRAGDDGDVARRAEGVVRGVVELPVRRRGRRHREHRRLDAHHVGETGWKARQTNPASEIEYYAATPENAKWYFDLLYGNPDTYPAWQGSAGGPPTIFYFEAFDEPWKGIDDGWGLWDITRQARYALCGLPAGPACNSDVYAGAGYYGSGAFRSARSPSTRPMSTTR